MEGKPFVSEPPSIARRGGEMDEMRLLMEDLKKTIRMEFERHELLLRNIHEHSKLDGKWSSTTPVSTEVMCANRFGRLISPAGVSCDVASRTQEHSSILRGVSRGAISRSVFIEQPTAPPSLYEEDVSKHPQFEPSPSFRSFGTHRDSKFTSAASVTDSVASTEVFSDGGRKIRSRKRASSNFIQSTELNSERGEDSRGLYAKARGWSFRLLSVLVVILDAAMVTWEADLVATQGPDHNLAGALNYIHFSISAFYILELLVLLVKARSCGKFLLGKGATWNWFNMILTTISIIESLPGPLGTVSSIFRLLRFARLLKLMHLLRPFRIFSIMQEFHKLLLCLASSMKTLGPAMILMAFAVLCVGILLTNAVGEHLHTHNEVSPAVRQELISAFGSVGDSMLSMYMAISAGRSWGEQYSLLEKVHPWLAFIFLCFLLVIIYGLTNVVTAVFVESAMQASQNYRDLLVHKMLVKERVTVKHMKEIFHLLDKDGSGTITLEEMKAFMENDNMALQEYLEALDLSINNAESLFSLLDLDGSGMVDIEEFCDGCIRLGGTAKSFDINCMWHEQRRVHKQMLRFIQFASYALESLARGENDVKAFESMAESVEQMLQSRQLRSMPQEYSRDESNESLAMPPIPDSITKEQEEEGPVQAAAPLPSDHGKEELPICRPAAPFKMPVRKSMPL